MGEQIHLGHRVSKAALQILQIPGCCLSLPELADLRSPPVVAPERGETQIIGGMVLAGTGAGHVAWSALASGVRLSCRRRGGRVSRGLGAPRAASCWPV